MPEEHIHMTEQQIPTAAPRQIARFLDQGRGVDQAHLRKALALALNLIADLQDEVRALNK